MSDKYNSKIAWLFGFFNGNTSYAVTISSTCTLYSVDKEKVGAEWRRHEDRHKKRIRRMGWCNHMTTYIWQMMTKGYNKSELEQYANRKDP